MTFACNPGPMFARLGGRGALAGTKQSLPDCRTRQAGELGVRNRYIDRLRGLLNFDCHPRHSLRFGGNWREAFSPWVRDQITEGAIYGVHIFFVVGGFLICRKFIADDGALTVAARQFYMQRIGRILPRYCS